MIQETIYSMNIPVSIALITDTHNHPADEVIRSLQRHKTDIICIAGDFVHARLPKEGLKMQESLYAVDLLKQCSDLAATYVSLGNHEWLLNDDDMDIIESTGITLLHNSFARCLTDGRKEPVLIGGLTSASHMAYRAYCASLANGWNDPETIYPLLKSRRDVVKDCEPETGWLDDYCREPGYKILLCHHPEYYPNYLKSLDIDLILSGHAHGGQIRIKGQGLYAPGQGFLPRLTSGIIEDRLVISRGLSNNTIIPRLWNPKEIVYILKTDKNK